MVPRRRSDGPGPAGYRGGPELTVIEHLLELRKRVFVCLVVLVIGVAVSVTCWETIFGWLLAPARVSHADFTVKSFSPVDRIGAVMKIGLYGGLILASPVVIYQALAFITPGLTPRERRLLAPGMGGVIVFLLAGMAFAYWVVLPNSLGFLLDLGGSDIENQQGIKQYMDFVTRIVFWVGMAFELPVVIGLAARLGLVGAKQLLHFWRYAVILVFVVSAIITPTPDPLNQSLVAGSLFALYLVGIAIAAMVQRPRPTQQVSAT